jgi:hypothetical protein
LSAINTLEDLKNSQYFAEIMLNAARENLVDAATMFDYFLKNDKVSAKKYIDSLSVHEKDSFFKKYSGEFIDFLIEKHNG